MKTRKISAYIRYGIIGCILSSLVLFGTAIRLGTAQEAGVGLRQQIVGNVRGITEILVIDNLPVYLLFLIVFIAAATAGELRSVAKAPRITGIIFASSVALIILARIVLQFVLIKWYWPVGNILDLIDHTFFDVDRIFPIIFCFLILLFILITVLLSVQREKLFVLYSIGMVSAGVMVLAPYLGARIFVITIVMLASITAYLASTINFRSSDLRKAAFLGLVIVTVLQMEKFYYYGEYVKGIETIRLQLIESYRARVAAGLTREDEVLMLPAYQQDSVYAAANPGPDDFHMGPFKRYYHLPVDTNVIFDDGFTVKTFTITQVEGSKYLFKVLPLYDERYLYTFKVRKKDKLIYTSPSSIDNFIYFEFPGKGIYTVSCVLTLPSLGTKEIYAEETVRIRRE
jgi:hypothetical protein